MTASLLLRDRLHRHNPSVQDFELAAESRLDDAMTLLLANRLLGAIYLFGYVAEIYLKIAVYRRLGARQTAQVHVMFRQAHRRAQELGLSQHFEQWESGHGLMFWARLLWSLPNPDGRELGSEERCSLYRHVRRIEDRWTVNMRYSVDTSSRREAETVQTSVEWIKRNRVALWR